MTLDYSTKHQIRKPAKSSKRVDGMSDSFAQRSNPANSSKVFALVDCNNFFVSCERLFRPALKSTPVAVLSNNDGCIVARSNEVKALGVKMGEPYFKQKQLLSMHKAEVFSANFSLYGDVAERVSAVLSRYSPKIEIYSIDEAFLQIDNLSIKDYNFWSKKLSKEVERLVGIPVSVGVGPTKTLAKLATEKVKKDKNLLGGTSLAVDSCQNATDTKNKIEEYLKWLPLEEIWGIGRKRSAMLKSRGLRNAYDVARLHDDWVLRNMTITGLRTIRELRGDSVIPLDEFEGGNQQKSLSVTRSFGRRVRSLAELEAAVASFSARAATRLRRKDQLAWRGLVFVRATSTDRSHRYVYKDFNMDIPTSYTPDIIVSAHKALREVYDPDFSYEKAGVILTSLVDDRYQQMSFFGYKDQPKRLKSQISLMKAIDDLSLRYGKQAVTFAAENYGEQSWRSKHSRVSPSYTTRWSDIPLVKQG